MWTVPGGKLVLHEYINRPKTSEDAWYGITDWLVKKEVKEEAGIKVGKVNYLTDLAFVRPDGFPVFTISLWTKFISGKVKLGKDIIDSAWVSTKELKKYEIIPGIDKEILQVDKILKNK